jgi:hypothetical protein
MHPEGAHQALEASALHTPTVASSTQNTYNTAKYIIQGPVTSNNFTIHSWDSKDRLVVSLDLLKTAFRESEMLREYCDLPEKNRFEPEFVNTYVLEALMAVIRQAHRSSDCQNIRANPSRADLVQVLTRNGGEHWEILTLVEAVKLLFRGAAGHMERLARSPAAQRELTSAERSASLLMPHEYRCRPERYEQEGKSRLAAHLATLGSPPAQPVRCSRSGGPLAELKAAGPATAIEQAPVPPRPPPFSPAAAAALLREHPPQLDAGGLAPRATLRALSEISGQDPSRIVNHLWDAKEEGLLTREEQAWAAALACLCDEVG